MTDQATRLAIEYVPPFDWPFFVAYLGARATQGVEAMTADGFVRHIEIDGCVGALSLSHDSAAARLMLTIDGDVRRHADTIVHRIRRMFDLDRDLSLVHDTLKADPYLGSLVAKSPGIRVPGAWSSFELLVRTIVGQQVTVKAATTIMGRIVSRFGRPLARTGSLAFLFPSPRAMAEADVSAIGMPGKRAAALKIVARTIAEGAIALPESGGSAVGIKEALLALPGIGPWTVEYFALRAMRDPDAWPATDLVLHRAVAQMDTGGAPTTPAGADRWKPYRGYAAMHLWHHASRERSGPLCDTVPQTHEGG